MVSSNSYSRRSALRFGAVASLSALLAGCAGPSEDEEPEAEEGTGNGQEREEDDEHEAEADDGAEGDDETDENEDTETDQEAAAEWEDVDSITLDANADGWNGRSPDLIEGETNPTLELYTGREYELTWTNNDGERHEFAILGDTGPIEGTEAYDEHLESHTLSFEATEEMVEYRCGIHDQEMVGEITLHDE